MKTSIRVKHDPNSSYPYADVERHEGDYYTIKRKVPTDTGFNFDVIALDDQGVDNLVNALLALKEGRYENQTKGKVAFDSCDRLAEEIAEWRDTH